MNGNNLRSKPTEDQLMVKPLTTTPEEVEVVFCGAIKEVVRMCVDCEAAGLRKCLYPITPAALEALKAKAKQEAE